MEADNRESEREGKEESPSEFLLNGHVSQLTSLGFFFFNFEKAVEELGRISACLLQSKREAQVYLAFSLSLINLCFGLLFFFH
jgi:hypothetical protein